MAAAAKLPFVYLPPGNYRMKKSVTINKPIMAGRVNLQNARLLLHATQAFT